ncbi:hypothetical protein Tco_1117010 [Tanacetum coccineum]
MLLLSLHAIQLFSSLQMFLKCTCTNSGILSISMKIPTGSEWTRRRNSTSIWKSPETSFRSVLEFMVKTLMNFPLMKILCLFSNNLVILGKSRQSPILLLIICINLGEILPPSSTKVYLERQLEDFTYQIDNKGHKKQDKMLLGLKAFLMLFGVTAALIDVNVAQSKLVLLENFNENYSKCLRLLCKVNAAKGVNAASERS